MTPLLRESLIVSYKVKHTLQDPELLVLYIQLREINNMYILIKFEALQE